MRLVHTFLGRILPLNSLYLFNFKYVELVSDGLSEQLNGSYHVGDSHSHSFARVSEEPAVLGQEDILHDLHKCWHVVGQLCAVILFNFRRRSRVTVGNIQQLLFVNLAEFLVLRSAIV